MVDDLVSRYRPPELLLGERHYGPPVDMWGAGCVMAEMWTRSPIMQVDLGVLNIQSPVILGAGKHRATPAHSYWPLLWGNERGCLIFPFC